MTPTETPQNPFSTVLSLKILDLIRQRDLDLQKLRNDYQGGRLTKDGIVQGLEDSEAKIADEVLEVVTRTLANLEGTVNKVLQLQEQMRVLREAAAAGIPEKV